MDKTMPATKPAETSRRPSGQESSTVKYQHSPKLPVKTSGRCQVLELPAELRNRIYEITFTEKDSSDRIDPQWKFTLDRSRKAKLMPVKEHSLLRTCRPVKEEATPVYYDLTTFLFYDRRTLSAWLKVIGEVRQAMLKTICISASFHNAKTPALALYYLLKDEKAIAESSMPLQRGVLRGAVIVGDTDKYEYIDEYETRDRMTNEEWELHARLQAEF